MKINNILNYKVPAFKSGLLTKSLYTLGNNDMLNASFVDVFAMDTPRTIVETRHRGKQAGIEMGFREYTGTFIAEFSSAVFAILSSKFISKRIKPNIKVNSSSWITNKGLDLFKELYDKSDKTPKNYIKTVLGSMSGITGNKTKEFSRLDSKKAEPIIIKLSNLIEDKTIDKKTTNKILTNIQDEIIKLLGADNIITLKSENHNFTSSLTHVLRDVVDSGKNIFFGDFKSNPNDIISKLKTMNNLRIGIAIPLSMAIALTNQKLNRYLTKKRTGIDNFVGENGYENNVKDKKEKKKEKGLLFKKLLSAGLFIFMLTKVMNIKKPEDLIKKLEFDGPATSGNAIKTIYGTLILGRIMASKDSTELRETDVRDYLGFLNWLVLGGFVAKGAGQILDSGQKNLFNITKEGKGIKHWLKDVSLKSQKEIMASGGNVKANLRKLNLAQISGIVYSAIMLGVLLPKLNIWMTKMQKPKTSNNSLKPSRSNLHAPFTSLNEFKKKTKKSEKLV